MDLVRPGTYSAKVGDHGVTETKSGAPQVAVKLSFETPDGPRQLTWFGSFKDTVVEHTIKALVACGLQGNNPAGPLEIGREVSIVVDVDKDQDGKDRNIVRWVNAPGGVLKKLASKEAAAKLEKFAGAVAAYKNKTGAGAAVKNHAPGATNTEPWD